MDTEKMVYIPISVKDRLPEKDGLYHVLTANGALCSNALYFSKEVSFEYTDFPIESWLEPRQMPIPTIDRDKAIKYLVRQMFDEVVNENLSHTKKCELIVDALISGNIFKEARVNKQMLNTLRHILEVLPISTLNNDYVRGQSLMQLIESAISQAEQAKEAVIPEMTDEEIENNKSITGENFISGAKWYRQWLRTQQASNKQDK